MEKKIEDMIEQLSKSMVDKIMAKSEATPATPKAEATPEVPAKIEKKVDENSEVSAVMAEMKSLVAEIKKARDEEKAAKEIEKAAAAKAQQKVDLQEMAKTLLMETAKELGITAPEGVRKSRVSAEAPAGGDVEVKKAIDTMSMKEFRALPLDTQDQYVYDHFRKSMGLDDIAELKKTLKELEAE